MKNEYEDIIHLPHHVSKTRPRMSMADRAAQFSPFAALVGYDAAISETECTINARINEKDAIAPDDDTYAEDETESV